MRSVFLLLFPMLGVAIGCAAPAADAQDADTATTTSAVVVVERATDATEGMRAEASARFIRVTASASAASALRSVGAGLDLPVAGGCAALSSLGSLGASTDRPLAPAAELLDVGTVSLEANGVATRLLPRQLPDVTDVVSGVVYARAADATLFPASTVYVVHIAGGGGMDGIDLPVSAPADPANVRVADQGIEGGAVTIRAASAVVLEWTDDGSGDDLYVDVTPSGVRCLLDAGRGAVPASFFDDAGTLSVHRLHREPLRSRGIDAGEIRFDFARSVGYVRR
jgi:hypothetical protein